MKRLLVVCALVACAPPRPTATLEGVPAGQPVSRGEQGGWGAANDSLRFVLEGVSSVARLSCQLDGVELGCLRLLVTTPDAGAGVMTTWPRTKVGVDTGSIAISADGTELARWPVSRTVIDEGLSVCVANTEGEDEGLPLDRCKALQPFGDHELPMPSSDAVVFRRAKFSLARGQTKLSRLSTVSVNDGEASSRGLGIFVKDFELNGPGEVELRLDTQARLSASGNQTLEWRPPTRSRVLTDLDPNPLTLRIRVGARAEVSRSLQTSSAQTLTAWADESGIASLVEPLPMQLSAGAPSGLTVRLAPTELGQRSIWPRLTLRDSTGEHTDRIPFHLDGIAASACKLEVADVNVGSVLVGETRLVRFAVKNVGQASCSALRVKRVPDWAQLDARPAPAPGETLEWTARISPADTGLLVGLIEVDADDAGPTFADFSFRIQANVSR